MDNIILAIDASTKSSGFAIFQNNKLIHYQCYCSSQSNVLIRIKKMTKKVKQLYEQYHPTKVIMQDILPQDVKHNQNVFKALIYLQASIVMELNNYGVPVELCTASHWRAKVGIRIGRGIKRDQLKTASKQLIKSKFNLDVNDDISDAICIGYSYILQNASAF